MKNFKEFAIPTVALFLICLVATTLLAVTNKVTAPKIAELSAQTEVETASVGQVPSTRRRTGFSTRMPLVNS